MDGMKKDGQLSLAAYPRRAEPNLTMPDPAKPCRAIPDQTKPRHVDAF